MTNFEWVKAMDVVKLGRFLCSKIDCGNCFASEHCCNGQNGIVEWLKAGGDNDCSR